MNPIHTLQKTTAHGEDAVRDEVKSMELTVAHHVREGQFQRSLSLIAGLSSAIAGLDVSYEHYRGSYSNPIMYTPVVLSGALFAAGLAGAANRRAAGTVLPAIAAITLADCVIGFGFHIRGIQRKPGGWRLPVTNIVMGPPLFAPILFGTSAYLGLVASFLRREGTLDSSRHRRRHPLALFVPKSFDPTKRQSCKNYARDVFKSTWP